MGKPKPKARDSKVARQVVRLERRLEKLCEEEDRRTRQLQKLHDTINSIQAELTELVSAGTHAKSEPTSAPVGEAVSETVPVAPAESPARPSPRRARRTTAGSPQP